ncbi:F0F1 ATP synthase subunit delta [Jeotgalicoccus sp. FSL K6-3177]|jgi:ATP synthase, F1 delta subunit|uniref:F0F1 ATP synthase subunit delta n=1 Tax=Jeotgalicoccus sp. FSL K6-3177 TaxID=2921494 RepID=UPI0030FD88B0
MANLSQKYAQALFDVAEQHGSLEGVKADFYEVTEAAASVGNFIEFMDNPKITREKRTAAVEAAFGQSDRLLLNLLRILSDKKHMSLLEEIYGEFLSLYDEAHNQARVTVESVYKLSAEELDQLGQVFIDKTGYEKLLITNEINEELIGGVRVLIGSKVYDGSLRNQLDNLRNNFKEHTNS